MLSPKDHLAYLLELAAESGAKERVELVRELADLLTMWPADYPVEARASFAALLARVEHDIDPDVRRELAIRLSYCNDAPLGLLKEFFFEVEPAARRRILERDGGVDVQVDEAVDHATLMIAAREKRGTDLAPVFASVFCIDELTATEIMQDSNGTGIAIACKGADVPRAIYSAITVLNTRGEPAERLAAYDAVPESGAAAMLAFWRKQAAQHAQTKVAA